ncbi:MAG: AMIN domain-containing protein [Terriglobales bacterium]
MPRFSYVAALLAAAALLPAPTCAQMSAQNSSAKSAQNGARVEHVAVRGTGAAMEVEIQISGAPVAPETQAITGPDRIVVDFPGALPSAALRALKVNRGALKGIRSGLFFSNPPITRIVLDLAEPQSYQISTTQISTTGNAIVVRLGPVKLGQVKPSRATAAAAKAPDVPAAPTARLQNASLAAGTNAAAARVSAAVANSPAPPLPAAVSEAPPPQPLVTVTFENGMLRIRAEKATLAQVLFEVQRQTQAEIAIPAGAEQEQVVADLGPAPARDVLGSLLNGSPYNFIFVGNELSLERVILTRRDPSIF